MNVIKLDQQDKFTLVSTQACHNQACCRAVLCAATPILTLSLITYLGYCIATYCYLLVATCINHTSVGNNMLEMAYFVRF